MNANDERITIYIFIAISCIGIIATLIYYFNFVPAYSAPKLANDTMNYSSPLPLQIHGLSRMASKSLPVSTNSLLPYLPVNVFVDTYENNTDGSLLEITTYIFGNDLSSNYSYNTFKSVLPTIMPTGSKTINSLPSNFQGMSLLSNNSTKPNIYAVYAISPTRGCLLSYSSDNSISLQLLINITNICLDATNFHFNKN